MRQDREPIGLRPQAEYDPFRRCRYEPTAYKQLEDATKPSLDQRTISVLRTQLPSAESSADGNTHLRDLFLNSVVLNEADAGVLSESISQSKLESLAIHPMRLPHDQQQGYLYIKLISDVLLGSTSLKKLHFTWNKWNVDNFTLLAQALSHNVSVTSLALSVNELGERGLEGLLQGLRRNESITDLKLSRCQISDVGVGVILEYLHQNSHIQSLSLENNKIGPVGAQLLLRAVQDHPTIRILSLEGNVKIGYVGLKMIGDILTNQKLTHVDLRWCHGMARWAPAFDISSHVAKSHEKARIRAGQALLEGMQRNSHIQDLRLDARDFSQDVLDAIEFYATLNRNFRYLLSASHGLAPMVWCFVFAKVGQSHSQFGASLLFFLLSEQPNLVQPSKSFGEASSLQVLEY